MHGPLNVKYALIVFITYPYLINLNYPFYKFKLPMFRAIRKVAIIDIQLSTIFHYYIVST